MKALSPLILVLEVKTNLRFIRTEREQATSEHPADSWGIRFGAIIAETRAGLSKVHSAEIKKSGP